MNEEISAEKAENRKRIFRLERRANKKRHDISLRLFITANIIVVCAVILGIYIVAAANNSRESYREQFVDNLKIQCEILSNELKDNNYVAYGERDLSDMLNAVASVIGGRIMIVNDDYKIIKDTFITNQNEFVVNSEIFTAFSTNKSLCTEKSGYIQYLYPVSDGKNVKAVIVMLASTDNIDKVFKYLSGKSAVIYVLIMIMCVFVANIIGLASVRGLKFINRQMEFTGAGHFDNRIPEKGFREFRMMTEKYNETINKLMVIDSTRQEFVSNVSHELKTPITSMKVLADSLVENEQADLPMYKEFMSDIAEEIDRETKIINDLLTLVKMDKKSAKLSVEEIDIKALLEVIIKRVTPIAQGRGIEISYESYRDVVAEVDEVKLSLAFSNIIENAVKYNVDNGWVKVTLNTDHKFFYVKVADSGVGIPDDCKDQVFERFYRVDKARSRDTGGTGLGLAITREAILMHKGNIKLYSESGQGTTFTIKIPLKFGDV